mmetsp:Transcript_59235/g.158508  ORF Transcript_59235/g.158508 Transcript_59235/m.158508 type:complete len:378 (+) Transcript_59235:798-1931(+)
MPKIRQLDIQITIQAREQDVFWFHVAVHNAVAVHEGNRTQYVTDQDQRVSFQVRTTMEHSCVQLASLAQVEYKTIAFGRFFYVHQLNDIGVISQRSTDPHLFLDGLPSDLLITGSHDLDRESARSAISSSTAKDLGESSPTQNVALHHVPRARQMISIRLHPLQISRLGKFNIIGEIPRNLRNLLCLRYICRKLLSSSINSVGGFRQWRRATSRSARLTGPHIYSRHALHPQRSLAGCGQISRRNRSICKAGADWGVSAQRSQSGLITRTGREEQRVTRHCRRSRRQSLHHRLFHARIPICWGLLQECHCRATLRACQGARSILSRVWLNGPALPPSCARVGEDLSLLASTALPAPLRLFPALCQVLSPPTTLFLRP